MHLIWLFLGSWILSVHGIQVRIRKHVVHVVLVLHHDADDGRRMKCTYSDQPTEYVCISEQRIYLLDGSLSGQAKEVCVLVERKS